MVQEAQHHNKLNKLMFNDCIIACMYRCVSVCVCMLCDNYCNCCTLE